MQKQDNIQDFIAMLFQEIQDLKHEVEFLRNENIELKTKLTDAQTKKNSNNSSKPPSSDIGNIKKTKSLKQSSGKKVGGQPGHKGNSLKMIEKPDLIEKHYPNFCTCCGNDLSSIKSIFLGRRQVIDIPKIKPNVTEYQVFQKTCTCGNVEKADYQSGIDAPISYGKNTQALLAYLNTRQYIPYKRLEEVLQSVFGLGICQASIKNILSKLSSKLEPTYQAIRQTVIDYPVLGADETSVNVNGKNHWAWTFQTPKATFIDIHPKRGYDAIKEIMFEGFNNSIIVSDCWSSYFKTDAKSHQLCTAHILRELEYLNERYKQQTWSRRLAKLIRVALHIRKTNNVSDDNVQRIMNKLCSWHLYCELIQ